MRAPKAFRAALAALLVPLGSACGGGGGDGGVVHSLRCSGAVAPPPDQIALGCPAQAFDSTTITVLLGGPSTSTDIYGVKFDLVFDAAVLEFLPPAMEGNLLRQDGASTILQADVAPGDPGRLVVAIARQGEPAGVSAADGDQVVLTLAFRGVARGDTSLAFENAEVVDSDLQAIPEIGLGPPLILTFQ